MRFLDLPAGGLSVRARWEHWAALRLVLPASADNAKLRLAVPELQWAVSAGGDYSIHFDDAVVLFGALLELPLVKDATWAGVYRFWEQVPGPLALWRAWLLAGSRCHEGVRLGADDGGWLRRPSRDAEALRR